VHPSLEDPPAGDWDDGPARDPGWTDVAAPEVKAGIAATGVMDVELLVGGASWVGARFSRHPDERFYGFGVRSDAAGRTTGVVENWVGEGPYQLDEYRLIRAITPRWALRQRRDAAYFPIPWLMSSRGFGVLIENSEFSRFRLDEELSIEVLSDRLRLKLFEASTPAEVLRLFTEATGRQPFLGARWYLGPWIQTGQADLVPFGEERRIIQTLHDADAPVSAVETHMRRLPGGAHEGRRGAERKRTAFFHQHGLASLTYLNPFVSRDYGRRFEQAIPALQQRDDSSPYLYDAYIGGREPPLTTEGQLDFTNPVACDLLAELASEAIEDGHDGWMEDFGEYTPPDAQCEDGSTGTEAHNRYPVLFHSAGARAATKAGAGRPVARFVRSGWAGSAPHSPLVWGGDPTTGWGFDGLASAVIQGLSAGLSGIAFWGSDIGGFFTLGDQELDPELLIRWIQFGALSPLMRTKAEGVAIPPRRRPQVWDPEILPHWRRWAKLHTQLSPYLLAAAEDYVRTGTPLMRHMCLIDPAMTISDQYLLGPDLVVAPVLEAGATERTILVPGGPWVDLWRSATYDEATGGIITHAPLILEGPATVTVPAPLAEIPVLVRLGAAVPMLPSHVWSLAGSFETEPAIQLTFANS
jgi:alpha-glucosidase (family GH31 glycosyl hydrolase)